jgi:hypothetical protein
VATESARDTYTTQQQEKVLFGSRTLADFNIMDGDTLFVENVACDISLLSCDAQASTFRAGDFVVFVGGEGIAVSQVSNAKHEV